MVKGTQQSCLTLCVSLRCPWEIFQYISFLITFAKQILWIFKTLYSQWAYLFSLLMLVLVFFPHMFYSLYSLYTVLIKWFHSFLDFSRSETCERQPEDPQESYSERYERCSAYWTETFLLLRPPTCCVCHSNPHSAPCSGAGGEEMESGKLRLNVVFLTFN